MNKLKKGLIGIGVAVLLLSYYSVDADYERSYEIIHDDSCPAFAKYCDGYIYIGNKRFLSTIDCNEGDILIEDKRRSINDPDMIVLSSCNIRDRNIRNDIIEVMQLYEEGDPTIWDRSNDSMRLEWFMHNLSYDFNVRKDRTYDVDFDNNDEENYNNVVLTKILKL